MRGTVISSTGSYLPDTIVRNQDLTQFPAKAVAGIVEKTGVSARRHAAESQCTSDLALESARRCLTKINFPPKRVEAIIVSTSSPDRMQPATATRVQNLLGAESAFAFDINSVCSGSVFGISLADSLVKSRMCDNVLFIAAEVYSRILNPKDFSTYPFFGDGAGAMLFRADDASDGVLHSCLRSDGRGSEAIRVPGGGTMLPFEKLVDNRSAYFQMDGKAVFEFAVAKGTEIVVELMERSGITADEVGCFICHQANLNIVEAIAESLGVESDRFFVNLDRYGNTASASVPIALDEAISGGVLTTGDLAVTVAFGGGLSWGANLLRI